MTAAQKERKLALQRKRRREREAAKVVVYCPACNAADVITQGAVERRRREGSPGYCRLCAWWISRGLTPPSPPTDDDHLAEQGLLTRQQIKRWAADVVASMTRAENRLVAVALDWIDDDSSRFAGRRKPPGLA